MSKAGKDIAAAGHLPAVLGVFQKLIASKANDSYGFQLLGSVVRDLPPDAYSQYLPTVWSLLFTRLQTSRTPRFSHGFGVFLSLFLCAAGPTPVVTSMDAVQPGIFGMVAQQVWLPSWAGVDGGEEGKLLTVAATKVLTECPAVYSNQPLWQQIRSALETRLRGECSL